MAEITAALVKELREKSGVGMMDCKKALQENDGDIQAAMDWLRAKGLSKAAKNAARAAAHVALDEQPDVDAINAAKTPDGQTVGDMITNLIATIGENMVLRRAARFAVTKGAIGSYVHNAVAPGLGKIGVLVALESTGAAEPRWPSSSSCDSR